VNADTVKKVTYAINGGYNALDERVKHTLRIAEIIMD
jgi:predicted chitinase